MACAGNSLWVVCFFVFHQQVEEYEQALCHPTGAQLSPAELISCTLLVHFETGHECFPICLLGQFHTLLEENLFGRGRQDS